MICTSQTTTTDMCFPHDTLTARASRGSDITETAWGLSLAPPCASKTSYITAEISITHNYLIILIILTRELLWLQNVLQNTICCHVFRGLVLPKITILSSFIHAYVIPNPKTHLWNTNENIFNEVWVTSVPLKFFSAKTILFQNFH